MTISRHFLFLVFSDPLVVGVLRFLRAALNEGRVGSRPHLTIQGPFEEKVSLDKVALVKKTLQNDVLFIGNPGVFETVSGKALFLSVNSPNLGRVWNKPDYPIEVYGFNPHVTLYEGPDEERVEAAVSYLKRYRVELLCRDFDILQYVPRQLDLFPQQDVAEDGDAIGKLVASGRLLPSFRAGFLNAVK